jgi:DNA-binding transcriptional ArsR family regulator
MSSYEERVAVGAAVFAHPLRVVALRECANGEASPSMIAKAAGVPVANASYHVRQLHDAGLLQLVDTAARRGAIEHFYRANGAASEAVAALRAATGELLAATTRSRS